MAFILTEKRDSTGIITLNHAEKRNALSETLIEEITSALEGFRALKSALSSCAHNRASRSGRPAMTSTSFPFAAVTRSAGTIPCAS